MSTSIQFENLLREYQPELFEKIKSEQNDLSKKILKLRLSNNISVNAAAKIMNVSVEEYLNFEFGEKVNKSVEDYNQFISLFEKRISLFHQSKNFSQINTSEYISLTETDFDKDYNNLEIVSEEWVSTEFFKEPFKMTANVLGTFKQKRTEVFTWKKEKKFHSRECILIN